MKSNRIFTVISTALIITTLFSSGVRCNASSEPTVSAESAVLMNSETGEILFSKNPDEKLPMASTTKIMTALTVLENTELSDIVTVSEIAVGVEGSSVYLAAGEKISIEDLLYCLLLQSANDAAAALAIHTAGSIEKFAELMNEEASKLSLSSTHFSNPHGLDADNHYTTARDLATLTSYTLNNDVFAKIVSTYKKTVSLKNGDRVLVNHNRMLVSYDGCTGVKTGYTKKCGRCLVTSAKRIGVSLICVTLNDPCDWNDHRALLDYGFSLYRNINVCDKEGIFFEIPVSGGEKDTVSIGATGEISFPVKANNQAVTTTLETRSLVLAPVKQGDFIGFAVFRCGNEEVYRVELYALETIREKAYNKSLIEKLFG